MHCYSWDNLKRRGSCGERLFLGNSAYEHSTQMQMVVSGLRWSCNVPLAFSWAFKLSLVVGVWLSKIYYDDGCLKYLIKGCLFCGVEFQWLVWMSPLTAAVSLSVSLWQLRVTLRGLWVFFLVLWFLFWVWGFQLTFLCCHQVSSVVRSKSR